MDHLQHISTPMVDVTLISSTHKLPQAQLSDAVVQRWRPEACNFIKKETLAQVFSCEFYDISKSNLFYRTPLVAASELLNEPKGACHVLHLQEIPLKIIYHLSLYPCY